MVSIPLSSSSSLARQSVEELRPTRDSHIFRDTLRIWSDTWSAWSSSLNPRLRDHDAPKHIHAYRRDSNRYTSAGRPTVLIILIGLPQLPRWVPIPLVSGLGEIRPLVLVMFFTSVSRRLIGLPQGRQLPSWVPFQSVFCPPHPPSPRFRCYKLTTTVRQSSQCPGLEHFTHHSEPFRKKRHVFV